MRYFVRVDCVPGRGVSPFDVDELERAAGLFRDALGRFTGVDGRDGVEMVLSGVRVAAQPGGVKVLLHVDAPELEFAEDAAWGLLEAVVEPGGVLDGWSVASCGVEPAAEPALEGPVAKPKPESGVVGSGRARLRSSAGHLRLGLGRFGHTGVGDGAGVSEDAAVLAAGAVMHAVDLVTDGLFADLVDLERRGEERSVAEYGFELPVLDELPEGFAERYSPSFVRRFIVATAGALGRLTSGVWDGPRSVAEGLAIRLLLDQAAFVLDLYDAFDAGTEGALAVFRAWVFDDTDLEELYRDDIPQDELGSVDGWFTPFRPTVHVHPYTVDRPV
ncbi:hypothetical protein LO772_29460 [Yinghuangia sp. ASG 101]|uniref:hypothetical protein n=1 Tax=Yinghuangia sp. ASG 101 TaxID=2896848 RepID=UPI001E4B2F62|nr:hypothetical protein [Yinghuangia sp. ASG 101]UGQ10899.1 hypothetical protein LO772_29460 [Yinghuangia sp. ASG 101]